MFVVKNILIFIFITFVVSSCGGGSDAPSLGADEPSPNTQVPQINVPGSSLSFTVNESNPPMTSDRYDYGLQTLIPAGFGEGEFTFELWIKPDNSFSFGPTQSAGDGQLTNWTDVPVNPQPSDGGGWWYAGNFLLDGHANAGNGRGTFSLQIYGGGRVRWHFYDSASEWGIQALDVNASPVVVDGDWHQITLVRRWVGITNAALELWVDGVLVATVVSSVRDDMHVYWDGWPGFLTDNEGWFWGTEKLTAIGTFYQYEDYKGLIDELRLWSRAKSATEIQNDYQQTVTGTESGLVGLFQFSESTGVQTCNNINPNAVTEGDCINLINMKSGYWSTENAPIMN